MKRGRIGEACNACKKDPEAPLEEPILVEGWRHMAGFFLEEDGSPGVGHWKQDDGFLCARCLSLEHLGGQRWVRRDMTGLFADHYYAAEPCEGCGWLVIYPSDSQRWHRFCSEGCEVFYYNSRRPKRPKTEKVCPECGEKFLARADAKTCSAGCRMRAHRQLRLFR
jgi:hypothetical protein